MPVPEPQPRSFEELHTERSYLLTALQHENIRATDLLRKIPPLEQGLVQNQIPQIRTKSKKQLGWLRYRIDEITRQEKATLARLGELTYEIQSRERWCQIENERRQHEQMLDNHLALWSGMEDMQMNPGSSGFQPQWYSVPDIPWPNAPVIQQQPAHGVGYDWQPSTQDFHPEPGTIHSYASELPSQPYEDIEDPGSDKNVDSQALGSTVSRRLSVLPRSLSLNNADIPCQVTNNMYGSRPRVKRNSLSTLPGIPNIWGDKVDK